MGFGAGGLRRDVFRRLIPALLLTITCGALVLPARAQTGDTIQVSSLPGLPSNQAGGEKYSISGTVVDAVTGEPIRKALVQVNGPQQRNTFTDGDGRFQLEAIPAGTVSLTAQKPGYFGAHDIPGRSLSQVEVGPKSNSVVLKLTPESVIAGKVTTTPGCHWSMSHSV